MSDMYKREDVGEDKIVLTITIPRDSFEESYNSFLKDQVKDSNIKGFRKGKVPTDLIEPSMKPMLQFETFEKLAPMYINTAIQKENIELIAPPKYSKLPKFDKKEDLEFKVDITIMPKFKLGNLKKIKVEKEKVEIKEEDVKQALKELKINHETDAKSISNSWAKEIAKKLELKDIKDLQSLKKEIKKLLKKQKEHMLLHKYQDEALRQAIDICNIDIPSDAIEFEANGRERSFEQDMQSRGVKIDDFLKNSGLELEQMREAWKSDAQQALESDVFLNLYADEKDIKIEKEDIDKKIEIIKKSRPDVDENLFKNEQWLDYIKRVERKEKAFKVFIEEVLGKDFL